MGKETATQRHDLTKPMEQASGGAEMAIKFPDSTWGIVNIVRRGSFQRQVASSHAFSHHTFHSSLTQSLIVLGVSRAPLFIEA